MGKNYIMVFNIDIQHTAPDKVVEYMEGAKEVLVGDTGDPRYAFLKHTAQYFIPNRGKGTWIELYSLETEENVEFNSGAEISEAVRQDLLKSCKIIPEVLGEEKDENEEEA